MSQQIQYTSSNSPENHASRGSSVVVSTSVFTALAVVCLSMRLGSRIFIIRSPGKDDLSITIAMLCSIGVFVTEVLEVENGVGKHSATLSIHDNEESSKFLWISIIFYTISITLSKMSLVFQYLRIFIGKKFRIICWTTQVYLATYGLALGIACILICVPVPAFWQLPTPKNAQCINKQTVWFVHAGLNISSDVIIFILPIPVIKTLKLHLRTKISLIFIFGLGLFGTLVSILRLRSLKVTSVSTDLSWDNAEAAIWSDIEINMTIICASLMAVSPLLNRFFPNLLSSVGSTAKSSVLTDPERRISGFMPWTSGHRTHKHKPARAVIESTAEGNVEKDVECGLSSGDGEIIIKTCFVQEVGHKTPTPVMEGSEEELIAQKSGEPSCGDGEIIKTLFVQKVGNQTPSPQEESEEELINERPKESSSGDGEIIKTLFVQKVADKRPNAISEGSEEDLIAERSEESSNSTGGDGEIIKTLFVQKVGDNRPNPATEESEEDSSIEGSQQKVFDERLGT